MGRQSYANLPAFDDNEPDLTEDIRDILTRYSGVPEADLVSHIAEIRDEAWKIAQYPCIGNFFFQIMGITEHPKYEQVLERVKSGESFLDLACGLGQDIRKLVYDNAPSDNIVGFDLRPELTEIGYQLFKDKDKLKAKFIHGDFFTKRPILGLEKQLFDVIAASDFFHLFSWDDQVECFRRATSLLKSRPGSMIIGRMACAQYGVPEIIPVEVSRTGEVYLHTPDSFRKLIKEAESDDPEGKYRVECGNYKWVNRATLAEGLDLRLWFTITVCDIDDC